MGYDGPLANPGEGEGPVRRVELPSFRVAPTTVTNEQFAAFVAATGWLTDAERDGWSFVFHALVTDERAARGRVSGAEWWWAVDGASWRAPHGPGSEPLPDHPVVHVSAADAEAYCAWSGARLPSEQEWERAARGGLEGAIYPWGDEDPDGRCNIWRGEFPVRHEDQVGTVAATSFSPNGFGLHQTSGNVWEWTASTWAPGSERRVRRGGSYLCHASYCNRYRVAARDSSHPGDNHGQHRLPHRWVISPRSPAIMIDMRQLLLRVPDEVHQRLAARAAEQGRSINALASEILDTATEGQSPDRRARLRARASALGMHQPAPARPVGSTRRRRILETTKGWGPLADDLIAYERDRV